MPMRQQIRAMQRQMGHSLGVVIMQERERDSLGDITQVQARDSLAVITQVQFRRQDTA